HHGWGDQLIAAKVRRDEERSGGQHSAAKRRDKAAQRAADVLTEALHVRRRHPEASQRSLSATVSKNLNRKNPAPEPPHTSNTVRAILRSNGFFPHQTD